LEGSLVHPMSPVEEETEIPSCWRVGVHTSIAGSLAQAAEKAHQIGCTAFQIFSTSPRMWKARPLGQEEISSMARLRREYGLHPLVIHANYLLNLASPDPALRERSIAAFREELGRASALGAQYLVLHPGSYRDATPEQGIRTLARSIHEAMGREAMRHEAMQETPPHGVRPDGVRLLIENTCGQGNTLGGSFAEIQEILALLEGLPVDCCLDTAHCFAAGMNVATPEGLQKALAEVDATVGLQRVKVIHANDSRSPLGSHRDWHEHIGRGGIGREGFRRIVNDPGLRDKVFILETPVDKPGDDQRNLRMLQSLRSAGSGAAFFSTDGGRREPRTVRGPERVARPQRGSTHERIRHAAGAR